MESSEATAGEDTSRNSQADQTVLLRTKPLHRFVKREPKTLGVVIVICGCAEVLMGRPLITEDVMYFGSYVPFWQGFLFLVCGSLSIYTEAHPSKKLVTVCLSMYIVTVLGIVISFFYRAINLNFYGWPIHHLSFSARRQFVWVQSLLLASSGCMLVILICLCTFARLALKSTHNQVIVHHVRPSQTTITSY